MDTALTGQFGIVESEVGDEIHPGRIKIRGESWRAVTQRGSNIAVATPVGVSCRLCERTDCDQRAFPSLRHPLHIDENVRTASLYSTGTKLRTV